MPIMTATSELRQVWPGADGYPATGWQAINGSKYFSQDDDMVILQIFSQLYYFYNDGTIAKKYTIEYSYTILWEAPNIYEEFDNDGVGKFISSDF